MNRRLIHIHGGFRLLIHGHSAHALEIGAQQRRGKEGELGGWVGGSTYSRAQRAHTARADISPPAASRPHDSTHASLTDAFRFTCSVPPKRLKRRIETALYSPLPSPPPRCAWNHDRTRYPYTNPSDFERSAQAFPLTWFPKAHSNSMQQKRGHLVDKCKVK